MTTRSIIGFAGLSLVLLVASDAAAGTLIRGTSNGIVGQRQDELYPCHFWIDGDRLKLADDITGRYTIIRLDRQVVYEADPRTQTYAERPFSEFQEMRREKQEEDRERIRLANDRLGPAGAQAMLAPLGLRPDGTTVTRTVWTGETRNLAGHQARRVQVLKNDLVVFDLWVTDDLPRPEGLIELYQAIGVYPRVLILQVAEIQGFPLRIDALVDLHGFSGHLIIEAGQIDQNIDIPHADFEVPPTFQVAQPEAELLTCPQCGREFPENTGPPPQGAEHLRFCSNECIQAYYASHPR